MKTDNSTYRINYIMKSYITSLKCHSGDDTTNNIHLKGFLNNQFTFNDVKKKQLIDQVISQVKFHFTTRVWGNQSLTIARDILNDLSDEHEERTAYGQRIQDSRGR